MMVDVRLRESEARLDSLVAQYQRDANETRLKVILDALKLITEELEARVATNEAAIADHEDRIAALEGA